MTPDAGAGAQPGILTLNIADKHALYVAYMPFLRNGGLFVPSPAGQAPGYELGDEVFLLLNLVERGERVPVAGKVVWVTPPGAQGQRVAGVGIQFSASDGGATQQKIETVLAGSVTADRPTHTL